MSPPVGTPTPMKTVENFKGELMPGMRLECLKEEGDTETWYMGEIITKKTLTNNQEIFYVHFLNNNKRLDEWISEDKMRRGTVSIPIVAQPKDKTSQKKSKQALKREPSTDQPDTKRAKIEAVDPPTIDSTAILAETEPGENEDEDDDEDEKKKNAPALKPRGSGSICIHSNQDALTRIRNINRIEIGKWSVHPWYFSPYPKEYSNLECLYICEFCLIYLPSKVTLKNHRLKCQLTHPPGVEVYSKHPHYFFEVDGKKQKTYCERLCLLAKMFLDHKTLYYDTDPFLFYILVEKDAHGFHLIGYFSKEKDSLEGYNVACILTLPQYQRKSYGKLLIEFSYALTNIEEKTAGPEVPLSDLGYLSYMSYWAQAILELLLGPDFLEQHDHLSETASSPLTLRDSALLEPSEANTSVLAKNSRRSQSRTTPASTASAASSPSRGSSTSSVISKGFNFVGGGGNLGPAYAIDEISMITGIRSEDVMKTLQHNKFIRYNKGTYAICITKETAEKFIRGMRRRPIRIDPSCITWTPRKFPKGEQ